MKMKSFLSLLLILSLCTHLNAQIIYVDANNSTGVENGSAANPYNTIEEGLAIIQSQDTLLIANGTYSKHSFLITRCITITGESQESTVVEGDFVLSSSLDTMPVSISQLYCNNVRCSDSGSTRTPLIIRDCILQNFYDTTSSVVSTGSILFENNIVIDSIYIGNRSCRGSREIADCETGGDVTVSSVSSKGNIRINDNQINGNLRLTTVSRADTIFIDSNSISDSLVIISLSTYPNIVTENLIDKGLSIAAVSSYGNHILDNQITRGSIKGSFISAKQVLIDGNELLNGGIDFRSRSANVTISNNTINSDGTATGIKLTTVSGGVISRNKVILPYLPPTGQLTGVDTNAVSAISVNTISFKGIWENDLQGGSYGIYLKSISPNGIANNKITSSHTGIGLATISCRVDSNMVTNCKGDGMILDIYPEYGDTNSIRLKFNTVINNGGHGIRVKHNAQLGIKDDSLTGYNVIRNNDGYDLYLETPAMLTDTIFALNNIWTHSTEAEISEFDIYDGKDNDSLARVHFTPFSASGINDASGIEPNFLLRNVPNPFHESAVISWQLPAGSYVELKIYDFLGKDIQTLAKGYMLPGNYQVSFNAFGMPAGIYFCKLKASGKVVTKKVIILK